MRFQIAARTLGDLVRKLGEKILPEIIPILEEGLRSDKSDERQGVCIGLSEIMKSTSKDAVSHFSATHDGGVSVRGLAGLRVIKITIK